MTPSQDFGSRIEFAVAKQLRSRGYSVSVVGSHGADLKVTSPDYSGVEVTVEVKGSHLTKYASGRIGYQFILFKKGYSARIIEDLLVLVCLNDQEPSLSGGQIVSWLIIPRSEFGNLNKIGLGQADLRRYTGRWSRFIDRWDLLPLIFALKAAM